MLLFVPLFLQISCCAKRSNPVQGWREIRIQHQNPSGGDREPLVSPEGTGVFIPRTPGETSEPDEQGESQDTAESDDTD